ncbi:hypothetical protein LLG95_10770 [bacterium]|nr:hypothetical protein [bacterium]
MEPNTHAPDQPQRNSRLKLVLKIGFCGFAAIFLFLLLGVGIPIAREISRPIAVPKFEKMADKLLVPADPRGAEKIPAAIAATKKDGATTTQTSGSPYSVSSTTSSLALRFKPFIPDTPDLPANIRAVRDSLNARFDKLLSEVEYYDKHKAAMSYQEARQMLDQIDKASSKTWAEIIKIHGDTFQMEGWTGEVVRRSKAFQNWSTLAEVEVNAKGGKWIDAALYSDHLLAMSQFEWENQRVLADPNRPVFRSDFYKQNSEDWDRSILCYRQAGGLFGYEHIVKAVLYRQTIKFSDTLGRAAWSISGR